MTGNITLLSLADQSQQITKKIIETGGEITAELEALLPLQEAALPAKVEAYAFTISQLEMQSEYFKERADYFAKVAKSFQVNADFMKDRMKQAARTLGQSEILGVDHKFLVYSSGTTVVIEDEAKIAADYYKEKVTRSIDKSKIEEDLKMGIAVEGARLADKVALKISANKKVK